MKNILNNIGKAAWLLTLPLVGVGIGACSDEWDSHYEAVSTGNATLWETINAQGDMKNFARLLQETGFSTTLNGSQTFTIFAPTDAVFTETECQTLIDSYKKQIAEGRKGEYNTVLKEFIMNHIALYNYSVSSYTSDSIVLMNGKYQQLSQNKLGDAQFISTNQLTKNGVLFVVDKKIDFSPNIYEYLAKDAELDSVSNFVHKYDYMEFSAVESVPGDIVNGKTQYLDSVSVLTNDMFYYLARINSEDSAYMAFLPTNEVWKYEIEKNQQYYNYDKTVVGRDSLSYIYPRLQILDIAFFSHTINQKMETDTSLIAQRAPILTIAKMYEPEYPTYGWRYIVKGATGTGIGAKQYYCAGKSEVACSNGEIVKFDNSWPFSNALLKHATINMEGEMSKTLDSVYSSSTRPLSYVYVPMDNPYYDSVSNHAFIEISQRAAAQTQSLFNICNVLSNVEYDMYVVTVPPMAADTVNEPKCNDFRVTLFYNDEQGKQQSVKYPSKSSAYFEADSICMSKIYIGTMKFPTCSFGLTKPQVKMMIQGFTNPNLVKKGTHVTTTRIDRFIFEPHVNK